MLCKGYGTGRQQPAHRTLDVTLSHSVLAKAENPEMKYSLPSNATSQSKAHVVSKLDRSALAHQPPQGSGKLEREGKRDFSLESIFTGVGMR